MKTLLRITVPAVAIWACALPAPQPLEAQTHDPTVKLVNPWQVHVRARGGFLAPRWQYAEDRSLPRRPTAGIEVLVRPAFSWYGGRLLLERATGWQGVNLRVPSRDVGFPSQDQGIEGYQSVVADFIYYPTWSLEVLPYVFAGGGFKVHATGDSEVIFFPLPFFRGERRAALHAGFGFEVPVKDFLVNMEVGDYYGEILEFGKVHDLHIGMVLTYTNFGALFDKLFKDRSEEIRPPVEERR